MFQQLRTSNFVQDTSEIPDNKTPRLIRLLACRKLEMRAVFIVWEFRDRDLAPEIWCEECICFRDGSECSFQEITHCCSRTLGLCVAVFHASKLQQAFRCGSSNDTRSSWRRNKATHDRSDLPADLGWHGVGFSESGTPVPSPDWDDRQFCEDDGAADGGGDFLCAFDAEADVSVEITNGNECLETGALAGTGLLLHGHDFHDFVFEFGKEEVNDLVFFDREGEEVYFFH